MFPVPITKFDMYLMLRTHCEQIIWMISVFEWGINIDFGNVIQIAVHVLKCFAE